MILFLGESYVKLTLLPSPDVERNNNVIFKVFFFLTFANPAPKNMLILSFGEIFSHTQH